MIVPGNIIEVEFGKPKIMKAGEALEEALCFGILKRRTWNEKTVANRCGKF